MDATHRGSCLSGFEKAPVHKNRPQILTKASKQTGSKELTSNGEQHRLLRWGGVVFAAVAPWVQNSLSWSNAAGLETVAESEPIDMGAIMMGDLVMLGLAPLFIFAALKLMTWEEKESEETSRDTGPLDPLLSANVRSVVKSTKHHQSSYVWNIADPELREIAETAAYNIESAVRDAQDTCDFQSSLHSLAVSHGGADAGTAWMDKVLKQTIEDVKSDSSISEKLNEEALDNKEEACKSMARLVAQKSALHELRELVGKVKKRSGRK